MTRTRLVSISLLLTGLLIASAALTGCGLGKPKMQSVPDVENNYHFYIPATWQRNITPGLTTIFAAENLPTDPKAAAASIQSAPSLLVVGSDVPSKTAVPQELTQLVKLRETTRKWRTAQISAPAPAQIGGRAAYRVDVTGTDANGTNFQGSFYLIRTGSHEYFLAALASPDKWNTFSKQLGDIFKAWYWQLDPNAKPQKNLPAP